MITKWANEARLIDVDFSSKLRSAEAFVVSGTGRTVELITSATAREVGSSDLTLSTPDVNSVMLNIDGKTAAIGQAVSLIVEGGTGGAEYAVRIEAITDAGQTVIRQITLRVI